MRVKHAVVLLMLISPLSWAGTTADCVPYITCGGRKYAVNFRAGALSGVSLYLVAVHDPARSGGA